MKKNRKQEDVCNVLTNSFIAVFLFLISFSVEAQELVINEILSSNQSGIQDMDGDHEDWIELYNNTNESINLSNYFLSDEGDNLSKWQFPNQEILPHSFLLVFASAKDVVGEELHTNFRIKSSGEKLYLSNSTGGLVDQIEAVQLMADESYARYPDASMLMYKIFNPSPGNSNNHSNQISFSRAAGFYQNSFYLKLSSWAGDTIYYTLDGSLPTLNSSVFMDSLWVENVDDKPNYFSEIQTTPDQSMIDYPAWQSPHTKLDKAIMLRCASFHNQMQTSKIYTSTYFIEEDIANKYDLPIISLIGPEGSFFDQDSGIYVPGVNYDPENSGWSGNYFKKGSNWEREVHIEYFENNGNLTFSQNAGIRIHGGKTRQAAQKSVKLYAREEYGEKYFNYPLLPNREVDRYKRFLLRTSMGAWGKETIIKDVLCHEIVRGLDLEIQEFQPVVVFLNGEYWGIHTLRDRVDARYISYLYGIDKDSIDLINGNYSLVEAGTNLHYVNLLDYIKSHDITLDENYHYVERQMDMSNYIDYMIAELFFANYDWPGNNVKIWRPQTETGKWRWIFFDLDAAFGDYSKNMFEHASADDENIDWPNPSTSTFLFRNLLLNKEFKSRFIQRYVNLLKIQFKPSLMMEKLYAVKSLYENEMETHIQRWNFPESYAIWEDNIKDDLLHFLEERPCAVKENMMDFFDLEDVDFDCKPERGDISSQLNLFPNPSHGEVFLTNNYVENVWGELRIVKLQGGFVRVQNSFFINQGETQSIHLHSLLSGIYVLQIVASDYVISKKLVIVNGGLE